MECTATSAEVAMRLLGPVFVVGALTLISLAAFSFFEAVFATVCALPCCICAHACWGTTVLCWGTTHAGAQPFYGWGRVLATRNHVSSLVLFGYSK